jgi:hypothetical protein
MAVGWIQNQRKKTSSYAINVDSKAALLAIANKHTTHPPAVATKMKTIELGNEASIAFHWVKGHAGLEINERADCLVRIVAGYKSAVAYDAIPTNRESRSWKTTTSSSGMQHTQTPQTHPTLNYSYSPSSSDFPFLSGQTSFSPSSQQITAASVHTSTE